MQANNLPAREVRATPLSLATRAFNPFEGYGCAHHSFYDITMLLRRVLTWQ
jgi:hypothetical protein